MSRDDTRSEPYGGRFTKETPRNGEAENVRRSQVRRAIVASTVGTSIEWYDFFLYGTAAALVFPKLFFPGANHFAGVLASFAIYAVGFAARPVGAAIFGHWGDRIGRKATLISTLLLMGIASMLIGVMPTYALDRRVGADAARRAADAPGHRRRRRVGRVGHAVHGVGQPEAPRLHRQLAAGRRADRPAALHRRGLAGQPSRGRAFETWGWRIPFLQHPADRRRPVGAPRRARVAAVRREGTRASRSSRTSRSSSATRARSCSARCCACPSRCRSTSSRCSSSSTARRTWGSARASSPTR